MLRVLVVCDSIGSAFGAPGLAETLRMNLGGRPAVTLRSYGGLPISHISEDLRARPAGEHDLTLAHGGNPDIHPRMPRRPLAKLRRAGLGFCREGLFSLPPTMGAMWLLRLPFFHFRLVFTRLHRDYYATVDEIVEGHMALTSLLAPRSSRLVVLPLFEVSATVHGRAPNARAAAVNRSLSAHYCDAFLTAGVFDPSRLQAVLQL